MWTLDYLWGFLILAAALGLIAGMVIEACNGYVQARLERGKFNEEGQWHFKN